MCVCVCVCVCVHVFMYGCVQTCMSEMSISLHLITRLISKLQNNLFSKCDECVKYGERRLKVIGDKRETGLLHASKFSKTSTLC